MADTLSQAELHRIEIDDLAGMGRVNIDDVLDYVHVPTAQLPPYLDLYDRYLRQQVEAELAPLLFGVPEDYKIFLTSHLEDEARHTVFFDHFYRESSASRVTHHGHP